jgi:hypothetical protein
MFISALLKGARRWKKPKYPPTDEMIQETGIYTYNGILVSLKKE